jgi:hypothetical protein
MVVARATTLQPFSFLVKNSVFTSKKPSFTGNLLFKFFQSLNFESTNRQSAEGIVLHFFSYFIFLNGLKGFNQLCSTADAQSLLCLVKSLCNSLKIKYLSSQNNRIFLTFLKSNIMKQLHFAHYGLD